MQEIREQLKNVIKDLYGLNVEPELTPSPDNIDADYSSNIALKLAKDLHKAPMEIANELAETLRNTTFEGHISQRGKYGATEAHNDGSEGAFRKSSIPSVSAPGFLNFTLPDEYYYAKIADLSTNFRENISSNEYSGQTVICEFSDPNPFKVLHVGHLYTSIVGDSISRLFEYAGAKVIRANFGGDVGLHVAKTMYILRQKPIENLTIEDIAKCYVEGTAAYEDSEEAHAEITELNKKIYQINQNDEHGTELADLYWKGRELSYEYFKNFYAQIGVKFDKFYPESTVADLGLRKVREELENGVYEMSDGAVIFNGEKYGLHTRVFINKEGVPTYETKDVGLLFTKWQDYHFDKSVVITGSEQLDYMKVVLKSVEQYAPELVAKTVHLTHGLVKLPGNVKMSSRKGNFLKAVDVLDMIKAELKSAYDSSDEAVALAATKYAFLKYKMGGHIIFDPKESVKMTGNSGPYLLYSAVRAKKILQKLDPARVAHVSDEGAFRSAATRELVPSAHGDGPDGHGPKADTGDRTRDERNLAKKILEYKEILQESVKEMAPHKVAGYLYELAQEFSRFYEHCPVTGSDREAERATLTKVYLDTMTHGLNILGINIPEEM